MKNKAFDGSVLAIALVIIGILFSACSIGNNVDSNEKSTTPNGNPDIITTEPVRKKNINTSENDEENEFVYVYNQCFVAPYDEYSIELLETQNFTPGYLLIKEDWEKNEYKVLLAKKFKDMDGAEFKNSVYVVTEENEIIEVSKTDGSYKTVYTAKHGSIDCISDIACLNRYVYFNDGNYIIELDPLTNECTEKLKSDKGIYDIYSGGDVFKLNDSSFYCDTCLERDDYFIWQDNDKNFYWHHPETGEDEPIEDINNLHTYDSFAGEYLDLFFWKVEK